MEEHLSDEGRYQAYGASAPNASRIRPSQSFATHGMKKCRLLPCHQYHDTVHSGRRCNSFIGFFDGTGVPSFGSMKPPFVLISLADPVQDYGSANRVDGLAVADLEVHWRRPSASITLENCLWPQVACMLQTETSESNAYAAGMTGCKGGLSAVNS